MAPVFNARDKSRTSGGKTYNLVKKNNSPPKPTRDGGGSAQRWQWLTIELMESDAFRTLTGNASKAFFRIVIEHTSHGATRNGQLIVTHQQFFEYGVTREYVADALDELAYKGLIKIKRGRAGAGTAHPNLYTLTFVGDCEGAAPTNEWKRCTPEKSRHWSQVERKLAAAKREKIGRKKQNPLRDSEMCSLRNPEIRKLDKVAR